MKAKSLAILLLGMIAMTPSQAKVTQSKASITDKTGKIAYVINYVSPHVELKTAYQYAIIIEKYSLKYDIDWKVIVAIIRQESNFVHGEIDDSYRDFGISQFNYRTIKSKQLDLGLLLTDIDYALHETVKHLSFLKKKFYTGSKGYWAWYTRWNSYKASTRKRYWTGTREHKYTNGLRNKFRLVRKGIKDYEVNARDKTRNPATVGERG